MRGCKVSMSSRWIVKGEEVERRLAMMSGGVTPVASTILRQLVVAEEKDDAIRPLREKLAIVVVNSTTCHLPRSCPKYSSFVPAV